MKYSPGRSCTLSLILILSVPSAIFAQQGTAQRTGLGTSLGPAPDGTGRYRENDAAAWSSPNFGQAQWAIAYETELNGGRPWAVVMQAARSNAGFTAAANKLTLDLGGFTYTVDPSTPVSGTLVVVDRNASGASLKIANGTFITDGFSNHRTIVGTDGAAGRLSIENATLQTYAAQLGKGGGSNGALTVESGGRILMSDVMEIGVDGNGSLDLRGPNSTVTAANILVGDFGTGSVTVGHSTALLHAKGVTGDLLIKNPVGSGIGLRVDAGTVRVDRNLRLSPNLSTRFGAVEINGGTVEVGGTVQMGLNATGTPETSGGKIYLKGGRLEVTGPSAFAPRADRQFYWKEGTLAFSGPTATLSEAQLQNYTKQGAATYGGGRSIGKLGTGQTLESEGQLTFDNGTIGLTGGSIKAANGLVVTSAVSGYGVIDAKVSGAGSVTHVTTGGKSLSVGALAGSVTVQSDGGELRIGHLGIDSTHTGNVTAAGTLVKTGSGAQTFKGTVQAGGVNVDAGKLVLDGGSLTAASVTNGGWIELTGGGTLTVGTAANPGQLINTGHLINGGTLHATVTGSGRVSGSGTFAGAVTVANGATLSPGNSPGTMNVEDLTFGADGAFELELVNATGVAGSQWDLAAVADVLSVTATSLDPFTIALKSLTSGFTPGSLANFDPAEAFSWKFASYTDPTKLVGFDRSKFALDSSGFEPHNSLAGGDFDVAARSDGLYVNFTPAAPAAVPEPSSLLLLSAAAGGAAVRFLRRRKRTAAGAQS